MEENWLPMEEAPKDGKAILIKHAEKNDRLFYEVSIAHWGSSDYRFVIEEDFGWCVGDSYNKQGFYKTILHPIGWMHLPEY